MPHTLPAILAQVRASGRPNSHGAILVREIERLTRENANLRAAGATQDGAGPLSASVDTQPVLKPCQEPV